VLSLLFTTILSVSAMGNPPPKTPFISSEYCYLEGTVDQETVEEALYCLHNNPNNKLYLDSPGGLVNEGVKLLAFVKKNNTTVLCKKCYSMAAVIFLNAKHKEVFPDSKIMMHYIWTFIIGPFRISDLRKLADNLEKASEELIPNNDQAAKQYIISKMKKGDFYFGVKTLDLLNIQYKLLKVADAN
jgi:ATP-dependent protease ClpP protease subunit